MKIAVLGAGGMLGKAVCEADSSLDGFDSAELNILHDGDLAQLINYDCVINCAGRPNKSAKVNYLGPKILLQEFGGRIVHVSTDCVFSGAGPHTVNDVPNPDSLYGISKRFGELYLLEAANTCVVRTSFVGERHGLLRWLLDREPGSIVQAWTNAWWSGSSVENVAAQLVAIAKSNVCGAVHLATPNAISKYTLLTWLIVKYNLNLEVVPTQEPRIDRSLAPTWQLEYIK